MTGKDVPALEEARDTILQGTRINVTFHGNEDLRMRLGAARSVRRLGFTPVPHLAARRLGSRADFERFLTGLHADGTSDNAVAVAGDPANPEGPYEDSLSLIGSGLLQRYGVRHVGISGYPEGHSAIPGDVLWSVLRDKSAALAAQGVDGGLITQFGFDADPVLAWIERVRDEGIALPVRVGVPRTGFLFQHPTEFAADVEAFRTSAA
jgi:methylenetetrahydrofolate reductase (NADPH)